MKNIILIATVISLFIGGCSTFSTTSSTSGKCWLTFPDGSIRGKSYSGSCWK